MSFLKTPKYFILISFIDAKLEELLTIKEYKKALS